MQMKSDETHFVMDSLKRTQGSGSKNAVDVFLSRVHRLLDTWSFTRTRGVQEQEKTVRESQTHCEKRRSWNFASVVYTLQSGMGEV
jgi:hypothetical protein